MNLAQATEHAMDGHAILFTGAGFSRGATNLRGSKFKTGGELATYLKKKCKIRERIDLDEAADLFLDAFGSDELIDELKKEYTVKEVAHEHSIIAQLPWKRIYTTNYDNVLETAYAQCSKKLVPATLEDDPYSIPKDSPICLHINGFIEGLDRDSLLEGFKLTNKSYLTSSFVRSPWIELFRADLKLVKSAIFIGYSLYDLDIKRILFEIESLKQKSFFVTSSNPTDIENRRFRQFGTVQSLGIEGFAQLVNSTLENYDPVDIDEVLLSSFEKVDIHQPESALEDSDVFDLFLYGDVDTGYVWNSLHAVNDSSQYYLRRQQLDLLVQYIENGSRNVLIQSALGNGKSMLIQGLKCWARENHVPMYILEQTMRGVFEEAEYVCSLREQTIIVIENYQNHIDLLRHISLNRSDKTCLVVTTRTSINDIYYDQLTSTINDSSIDETDLNYLADEDIHHLIDIFDNYGLWGDMAGYGPERKFSIIDKDCNRELQALLLKIIASPDIQDRFSHVFRSLDAKSRHHDVIILIFMLQVLNIDSSIEVVMELLESNVINQTSFRNNAAVRQLVDFSRGKIRARSSVLAKYMLQSIVDSRLVVDLLIDVTKRAESLSGPYRAGRRDNVYDHIFLSLTRYGTVQDLLPKQGKRSAVISFYESIKNLPRTRRNPHFWLQYAVARLAFQEYPYAKRYFDTSYSLARKYDQYDTSYIDNHYARYLLESSLIEGDSEVAIVNFKKAHKILSVQAGDNTNRHYPFRVARKYADIYSKYFADFKPDDQSYLLNACKFIVSRIDRLPSHTKSSSSVIDCERSLRQILEAEAN